MQEAEFLTSLFQSSRVLSAAGVQALHRECDAEAATAAAASAEAASVAEALAAEQAKAEAAAAEEAAAPDEADGAVHRRQQSVPDSSPGIAGNRPLNVLGVGPEEPAAVEPWPRHPNATLSPGPWARLRNRSRLATMGNCNCAAAKRHPHRPPWQGCRQPEEI